MDEFYVGQTFDSFDNLENWIKNYEEKNYIQLYKRNSQTVESAIKRTAERYVEKKLKYVRLTYSCIHGGRNFCSTSNGNRPNTRYRCPVFLYEKNGFFVLFKSNSTAE